MEVGSEEDFFGDKWWEVVMMKEWCSITQLGRTPCRGVPPERHERLVMACVCTLEWCVL